MAAHDRRHRVEVDGGELGCGVELHTPLPLWREHLRNRFEHHFCLNAE